MQDNLFERDVDPVDAVMERQASISDELTPQERLWLSKNHTVRVGVDPDFYPLEKFDAEGRYTGIGPDYLRILHKMTGLSFRIAPPSDWTNTIDMATSHKVDMYIAAAETQHRSQYMLFTPSYIVLPGIIVTRQPTKGESVTRGAATDETEPSIDGLKDLAGKRVAVVNRYSWHDFLEELHPEITPVPVKNTLEGLQKVAFGEVDAMIDYQFNITEKSTTAASATSARRFHRRALRHAFGIRKDWPELHSIINKALSKITPEERRIIAQKWLQPYEKKRFPADHLDDALRGGSAVHGVCLCPLLELLPQAAGIAQDGPAQSGAGQIRPSRKGAPGKPGHAGAVQRGTGAPRQRAHARPAGHQRRAPARQGSRRRRHHGEKPVPRQHQPRNTHAPARHHGVRRARPAQGKDPASPLPPGHPPVFAGAS
ncbi:MAG: transporter substrate-binding domain-containing protein [Bilophila wadsworthia]